VSDCATLRENYEAYALGALEGEERAAIERHLAEKCAACTLGVQQAGWLVAHLAYLAPEAVPPAALRARVMDAAQRGGFTLNPRPRSFGAVRPLVPVWAWAGAVAAALLFSAYTARQAGGLREEVAALHARLQAERARATQLEAERKQFERMLAIVGDAGTRGFVLKAAHDQPLIQAYWNEQLGVVLAAQRLPQLPAGRTFQLWIVPRQGAPISAGLFRPDAAGAVVHIAAVKARFAEAAALAVTNEPAGGRPTPTLPPMWAAPVAPTSP
jgi:anti-sigma-K factor RskA